MSHNKYINRMFLDQKIFELIRKILPDIPSQAPGPARAPWRSRQLKLLKTLKCLKCVKVCFIKVRNVSQALGSCHSSMVFQAIKVY